MPQTHRALLERLEESGQQALLRGIRHGLEKEGLRVGPDGRISSQPHPRGLGAALTHPRITTDYSEALVEFVTPVFEDIEPMLAHLADLHRYSHDHLGEELIWCASMPPRIDSAEEVRIAEYGDSHNGRLKHIYRVGLDYRYGRIMQSIAGIHFNFSLPDELWSWLRETSAATADLATFRSEGYFGLIRNFRRHAWLLSYLFGASPALSHSFVEGQNHGLETLDRETLFGPHATSLRMSDLGYSNRAQSSLNVCYNTLGNYVDTLADAIARPHPAYEAIGVQVDGHYRQLNTNLLQIENEYYSDIRPKRVVKGAERPLQAIATRGVEYVEVRNIDLNPFVDVGIDAPQARFLDTFLLYCLLSDSPFIEGDECDQVKNNLLQVVRRGRDPDLSLVRGRRRLGMRAWAHELLDELKPVASALDLAQGSSDYTQALEQQRRKVENPALTPSAQLLEQMRTRQLSHDRLTLELSAEHRRQLGNCPLEKGFQAHMEQLRAESLAEQKALEADSQTPFEDFLRHFLEGRVPAADSG